MEEKDADKLYEISDGHGSSGSEIEAMITNDPDIHLPAYLAYLSLGFKVISTVIIMLMAGWVILTIKTTRRLRKTHNIYVAYLMAIDVMIACTSTLLSGTMMIGYFTGLGDFIGCNIFVFMLYPSSVIYLTLLVMSIDKVIAITFPFKHREIMKPQVVCGIIVVKHILAMTVYARNLVSDFTKVAQFGTCARNDSGIVENLITFITPMYLTCLITVSLDVYLTIKAYQVHKQIQEESELSGGHTEDNDQLKNLKKIEATIKKHLKPVITLMVTVIGNSLIGLLFPILYISAAFLESPTLYENIVRYIITPNIGYITFLIHPFAYALYYKQVREPMIRLLKRTIVITSPCKCKSATVAPEPQRN